MSKVRLLTGASHALAYKLAPILGGRVILGESVDLSFNKQYQILLLPQLNDPSFANKILNACLDNQVSEIYPLKQSEIRLLNPVRTLLNEFGIDLICPLAEVMMAMQPVKYDKNKRILIINEGRVTHGDDPAIALSESLSGIFLYDEHTQGLELLIAE